MTKNLYNKKYYQASKKFQKEPKRVKQLADIICSYKPKSVLDVGCGLGYLVKELNKRGIKAYGIDWSKDLEEYWMGDSFFWILDARNKFSLGDRSMDIVVSSDFLEHIEEKDLDQVLSEMMRVGKVVLARVAYEDNLTPHQALYHCTNKPKSWWEEKLKPYGVKLI